MAEYPSLPLFTDAFISDTIHLSAAQTGAYLMLLMCAWRSPDCSLPDDDKMLARFARMEIKEWRKNRSAVMSFWQKKDGVLIQKRLKDERKFADEKRDQAIRAGKASALKRKKRHSTDAITPVPTEQPTERQRKPNNPTPTPTEERNDPKEGSLGIPPPEILPAISPPEIQMAFALWNDTARRCGLTEALKLTDPRKSKLRARLKDCGGLDGWKAALGKVEESPYLRGDNDHGWKADFDFILQEKSFTRLLEGFYNQKIKPTKGNGNEKFKREPTKWERQQAAIQRAKDALGIGQEPPDNGDGAPMLRHLEHIRETTGTA